MSAAKPVPVAFETVTFEATVAYFEMSEGALWGAGILKGDTAVVLLNTPDVRPEDLVLVHTPEGLRVLQYHDAPGGRVKLRTLECARSRRYVYERKDAVVLGRVVQIVSMGKPVQTLVKLRPVC